MKPRSLLSTVVRLPPIAEMQESDTEDGDLGCSSHTMEEYVDSIKELSQPAPYPLHGPLRGHRCWILRRSLGVTPASPSICLNSSRAYAPWIPIDLSDVSFTLTDPSNCELSHFFNWNLLDRVVAQSLFAGLVWAKQEELLCEQITNWAYSVNPARCCTIHLYMLEILEHSLDTETRLCSPVPPVELHTVKRRPATLQGKQEKDSALGK